MKKVLLIAVLLCLSFLIAACAPSAGNSGSTESPTDTLSTTELIENMQLLSDEDLIRKMTESRELEKWALSNYALPTSELGISVLKENSPEFSELIGRDTAKESLCTLAPIIAEEFLQKEDPIVAVQGRHLAHLVTYLYPETEADFDEILSKFAS